MSVDDRKSDNMQTDGNEGISGMKGVIPLQRCPYLYIKDTPSKGMVGLVIHPPPKARHHCDHKKRFHLNCRHLHRAKEHVGRKEE